MNKDNAKAFLPLVQALADGKVIEYKYGTCMWDVCGAPLFDRHPENYRVQPDKKWYRVGLHINGHTTHITTEAGECAIEDSPSFSRWLTDRVYYNASIPQPKKQVEYRVALMKGTQSPYANTCLLRKEAELVEKREHFIRWLTDWTVYDLD